MTDRHVRPSAVVVGLDCITGLQSARILARHGVPVIGVASDPAHFCARTRSVRTVIRATTSSIELIEALERLGPTLEAKAVLYPCTDASVLLIAQERRHLEPWFHVALPETELLVSLMDKVAFLELAERCGLPVPLTRILSKRADAERAARDLMFPCILKPAIKTPEWELHSPVKVHRVEDGAELLRVYDEYARHAGRLIVQQWIEGGDDTLFSCNCYYDRSSRPVCSFVARKLRQWPPRTGTSSLGEEVRNDTVRDFALRLFGQLGFRGLGYLEVKRDPRTGEHFVIEANPGRPTGRSAIAEAGGVEMLYAMYCDTLGLPLPEGLEQQYRGAKWIFWRQDFRSALHYWWRGELSLREWAASWRGRKTSAVFSWSDPGPALADIPVLAREAAGHLWRRRARAGPHPRFAAAADASAFWAAAPVSDTVRVVRTLNVADYDIHGVVGVRLIDAAAEDRAAVESQIGRSRGSLRAAPDITVRFVERIPTDGLRYVEVGRSGFTGNDFLLRSNGHRAAWVRVPFDTLGGRCEFVCERGARMVPLLKPALRLTALRKGYVPFHASAFEWQGAGIIVAGWAHGGKTSALLAFADRGARFIGDELILLTADGRTVLGFSNDLSLSTWQVSQLVNIGYRFGRRRTWLAGMVGKLARASAPRKIGDRSDGRPRRFLHAAVSKVDARLKTRVSIDALFAAGTPLAGEAHRTFFMTSHADNDITVEPTAPHDVARRMSESLRYEALPLLGQYHAFRFAFPDRRNPAIEVMHEQEQRLLSRALADHATYVVRHPYPAPLNRLFEAMQPFCGPAVAGPAVVRELVSR